jgi:hypothetical protein
MAGDEGKRLWRNNSVFEKKETQSSGNHENISGKWPQESRKIREALNRNTEEIETALVKGYLYSHKKKGKAGWMIGSGILFLAILAVLYFFKVRLTENKIKENAEVVSVSAISENGEEIKSDTASNRTAEKEKTVKVNISKPSPAKCETLWLNSPLVADSLMKKSLKVRLILDPEHKGEAKYFVNSDSTWILMRAPADSSKSLRKVGAYINFNNELVIVR